MLPELILDMMTEVNWSELLPSFVASLAGASAAVVAGLKAKAIQKGLSGVVQAIANFQPTATPDHPGDEFAPYAFPYIPMNPAVGNVSRDVSYDVFDDVEAGAWDVYRDLVALQQGPKPPYDPCKSIEHYRDRIRELQKRGVDEAAKYPWRDGFVHSYDLPEVFPLVWKMLSDLARRFGCRDPWEGNPRDNVPWSVQ